MIDTPRLALVPMTPAFLDASLRRARTELTALLDADVPDAWFDDLRFARLRLAQLRDDPTLQPWLLRAMVAPDERVMVGHIGCHGRPDTGSVELGYTVFQTLFTDGAPDASLPRSPHVLTGGVDEIVAEIVRRREQYGFSYVQIMEQQMEAFAPVVARLAGT